MPDEISCALKVFAKFSDTHNETLIKYLTAGNTIEILMGIA